MATLKEPKVKSGYVISIQDLGLNTTLRTKTNRLTDARRVLRGIQDRVDIVKQDRGHDFYEWTINEQRRFIKTGFEPRPLVVEPMGLKKGVAEFLSHVTASGKSRNTITSYSGHLKKSVNYFGDIPVETIDLAALQGFVAHLSKHRIDRGRNVGQFLDIESQKKAVGHLRMLVAWLIANRDIKQRTEIFSAVQYGIKKERELDQLTDWVDFETRVEDLKRLGIDSSEENAFEKTFFTKPQLLELLNELEAKLWLPKKLSDQRLYVATCIAAYTGLRRSEITRIKRNHIRIDYGEITILRRKGRKDNEFLKHIVHLPERVAPFIQELLDATDQHQQCVFVEDDSHVKDHSFDEAKERRHCEALGRRLKQAGKRTKWNNALSWHKFRHSLASILLSEGKTQTQVKEVIGWCTDEMAERYQHLAQHRKAEIIQDVFDVANV